MPVRDNLFVTLADSNYIEQAKQLFSSLYFNGGWKGDYMLLSHDIPDEGLRWFRKKGILVRECAPLYAGRPGGMSPALAAKFYLFTPEFKRWKNVIYCDGDTTIRASLDGLSSLKGFYSIEDISRTIKNQVVKDNTIKERKLDRPLCKALIKEITEKYDLAEPPFCAGFFAFSTDIITRETFWGIKGIMDRYRIISEFGDQLSMNLFFYKKWKSLSPVYNIQLCNEKNRWRIPPRDVRGIALHFITEEKPWLTKNYFYREWQANLDRAESIDMEKIPQGKRWGRRRIMWYTKQLKKKDASARLFLLFDRWLGWIGIGLKKNIPGFYNRLKRIELWIRK